VHLLIGESSMIVISNSLSAPHSCLSLSLSSISCRVILLSCEGKGVPTNEATEYLTRDQLGRVYDVRLEFAL
jgi:hypothetical protein